MLFAVGLELRLLLLVVLTRTCIQDLVLLAEAFSLVGLRHANVFGFVARRLLDMPNSLADLRPTGLARLASAFGSSSSRNAMSLALGARLAQLPLTVISHAECAIPIMVAFGRLGLNDLAQQLFPCLMAQLSLANLTPHQLADVLWSCAATGCNASTIPQLHAVVDRVASLVGGRLQLHDSDGGAEASFTVADLHNLVFGCKVCM